MLGGARWLCVLLILVGSSAWAEGDEYKGAVDKATALLDAGKYEEAVAAYSKIMLAQRQSCTAPPAIDDVAKLARTSPCWRMLMMQFNIALTRKRQGNTQKKLDAFRTYVTNWRHAFPKLDYFPLIERATYEIAAARAPTFSRHSAMRWLASSANFARRLPPACRLRQPSSAER